MNYAVLDLNYNKQLVAESIAKGELTPTNINDGDRFIVFNKVNNKQVLQHIKEIIDIPKCVYQPLFYSNPPNDNCDPHIDLGRRCAINFPINVAGEVITAKDASDPYFKQHCNKSNDAISFPTVDQHNQHLYNSYVLDSKPILLNTKAPHAAINPNNTIRYILSLSVVTHTYHELLDIFQSRGQVINTL